jgi:hypothetical protein
MLSRQLRTESSEFVPCSIMGLSSGKDSRPAVVIPPGTSDNLYKTDHANIFWFSVYRFSRNISGAVLMLPVIILFVRLKRHSACLMFPGPGATGSARVFRSGQT